ncbi:hypothetical protein HZA42_00190 [Candidatus Peregrinibacteria bacterium]|nr:hypothetical protein [Candidatus Peregrinibacteria bacterium]
MKDTKVKIIVGVLIVAVVIAVVAFSGTAGLFKGSINSNVYNYTPPVVSVVRPTIKINSQYDFQTPLPDSGVVTLLDFTATAPKDNDAIFDQFNVKYNFESGGRMMKNFNLVVDEVIYWHPNYVVITDKAGQYVGNNGANIQSGNGQLLVSIKSSGILGIKAGSSKRLKLVGEVTSVNRIKVDLIQ